MGNLQPDVPLNEDDAEWDRRRRRYLLEKEEREANANKPQPPQKGKRLRVNGLSAR